MHIKPKAIMAAGCLLLELKNHGVCSSIEIRTNGFMSDVLVVYVDEEHVDSIPENCMGFDVIVEKRRNKNDKRLW